MSELFDVYQFFKDESYEKNASRLPAKDAVERAKALTETVGAKLGTTVRVIITDLGDSTVFEWKFGEGVTFPTALDHIELRHKERITLCNSCRKKIIYLPTKAGKQMPVDAETVAPIDELFDAKTHTSHFATCPHADKHRKPR